MAPDLHNLVLMMGPDGLHNPIMDQNQNSVLSSYADDTLTELPADQLDSLTKTISEQATRTEP